MNKIEAPAAFLKNISLIIAIVIGGYYSLQVIFATQEQLAMNSIADIEAEIDTGEKLRDHYQFIEDHNERQLTAEEKRRQRVNGNKLDRLYDDLGREEDKLAQLRQRSF
jgi:hypothetical protein